MMAAKLSSYPPPERWNGRMMVAKLLPASGKSESKRLTAVSLFAAFWRARRDLNPRSEP